MNAAPAKKSPASVSCCETGFNRLMVGMLAFIPLLGVIAPRAMALMPAVIMIIGFCFYVPARRTWRVTLSGPVLFWVLGVLVLAGLSAFWALNPEIAVDRVFRMIPILVPGIILLGLVQSAGPKAREDFSRLFPLGVLVAAVALTGELYFKAPLYHLVHGQSITDEFNLSHLNRSVVCVVLALFCAFPVLYYGPYSRRIKKTVLAALILFAGAIIYKTSSQSAQLAFLLGVLFLLFFPYRCKVSWVLLGLGIAAAFYAAPWISQYAFRELAGTFHDAPWLQNGYAAERLEIWDYVSRYALQQPFYGFGIEATRAVKAFDTAQIYQKGVDILHPHNFALQIWIEFGILGVTFTVLFFADLLKRFSRLPAAAARCALPVFIASLSVAATGYGLWQGWWLGEFFLIAAFVQLFLRHCRG